MKTANITNTERDLIKASTSIGGIAESTTWAFDSLNPRSTQ